MNSEFGLTAWGRGWVRLAAPVTLARPNPAIPRGLSLARNDRVRELHTAPGALTALVDDKTTYEVHIALPTWDRAELDTARRVLADAGDGQHASDPDAAFAPAGLSPVPEPTSVTSDCPCKSRTRPCAHVVAVCLEFARRIDERPITALGPRGLAPRAPVDTALIPLSVIEPSDFYRTPPSVPSDHTPPRV